MSAEHHLDKPATPATEREQQEDYEINVGDVLFVKRNLRDPSTGEYLRDQEGKIQKELEDGWEVIDMHYENPVTGNTEILLQNAANPDEAKPVPEWRLREVQEEAEEAIAARAAARMMELDTETHPKAEVDPILEKFYEDIAEDLGEKATEDVVEVDDEPEETAGGIEEDAIEQEVEEDEDIESMELIASGIRQFELREHYATEELQQAVSTALNAFSQETQLFGSTVSVLRTTETIKLSVERALQDYEESTRQLEGRNIIDYDPRVTFYRQLDHYIGQLYSVKGMVGRVTDGSIVTMMRSSEQFERTLHEVEHLVDRDEGDVADYLENLARTKGIDTPRHPEATGIRDYLKETNGHVSSLNRALFDIDEKYGNVSEILRKLINTIEEIRTSVQHGSRPTGEQLGAIRSGFNILVNEESLAELNNSGQVIITAVEAIQRSVPSPPRRSY